MLSFLLYITPSLAIAIPVFSICYICNSTYRFVRCGPAKRLRAWCISLPTNPIRCTPPVSLRFWRASARRQKHLRRNNNSRSCINFLRGISIYFCSDVLPSVKVKCVILHYYSDITIYMGHWLLAITYSIDVCDVVPFHVFAVSRLWEYYTRPLFCVSNPSKLMVGCTDIKMHAVTSTWLLGRDVNWNLVM